MIKPGWDKLVRSVEGLVLALLVLTAVGCQQDPVSSTPGAESSAPALTDLAVSPQSGKAAFKIRSLNLAPSEVTAGQESTVTVVVENTGTIEGTYAVPLSVGGAVLETKEVTLTPGSTKSATFSIKRDTAGTYEIEVEDATATLTVKQVALATGSPATTATPAATSTFFDDFSNSNSGWPLTSAFQTLQWGYVTNQKPSYYHVAVSAIGSNYYAINQSKAEYTDFTAQVEVTSENGQSDGGFGLSFRRSADGTSHYVAFVYPMSGTFRIWKVANAGGGAPNTATDLVPAGTSPLIKTRASQANQLRVECRGSEIKVYVNDQLLSTITDSAYKQGMVCPAVSATKGTVDVRFYSFRLVDLAN